jgi:hypothetical protein
VVEVNRKNLLTQGVDVGDHYERTILAPVDDFAVLIIVQDFI